MRRLAGWGLAALSAWLIAFALNAAALDTDLSWTVTLDEAKADIADALVGSRIILLGGSHTHYSISAEAVEEKLGCAAVNFGLHGGLGLNAILARAEALWRPGDIVVVFPEYGLLSGDGSGWLAPAFGAALGQPGIGGSHPEVRARSVLRAGTTTMHSFLKSIAVPLFGQSGRASTKIGPRGDTEVFLYDQQPTSMGPLGGVVSASAGRRISFFVESATSEGVRVFFNLPWTLVKPEELEEARDAAAFVAERLGRIAPVLSPGASYNLSADPTRFSDSGYHSTPESRRTHSDAVAESLAEYILGDCGA